jgi:hypothetical protein
LIFSRLIFLKVLKNNNYGGMNLKMEKKCEYQHHLNVFFFEKSLDLDCKNGLSFTLFG